MASRQFCDRCPCEIPQYRSVNNRVSVPNITVDLTNPKHVKMVKAGMHMTHVDLCDKCMGLLKEFLGLDQMDRIPDEN